MSGHGLAVEPEALRASVREKYRHVASGPSAPSTSIPGGHSPPGSATT